MVVHRAQHLFEFAGDLAEFGDVVERFGVGDGAALLGEVEREDEERGELGWKALVLATPISVPALVVIVPGAARVMAAPTTLQMARFL